ncbi:L-seryl-tRNA(Sec) selenium transferase [Occallatibacter savannae]|uniref:L-seryl-tRNA(Sec) selenium transferase n=1 Tax=Occallatibacter savannae TaxID=1002691 RepID=UPI0013A58222|nr:L-seryl-tRNA(Sec) selenium transferase [Occallatibacter savannae]
MAVDPMERTEQARELMYSRLPSVNELLRAPELRGDVDAYGHDRVVVAIREQLQGVRRQIASGEIASEGLQPAIGSIAQHVRELIRRGPEYSLKPVINATGVVLHTNLGRAPLSEAALAHVVEVARDYCNLELDLESGERSKRDVHAERLVLRVLGIAEEEIGRWSVTVVNNCAAATFLALNTLAERREVVVSRGELVEIGGGFRIPEILEKSGAILREVGTTNRTRAADYELAVTEQTALLLRVHQSNFSIEGFAERPSLAELVELAKTMGVPLFEDQGTGLIERLDELGVAGEPTLPESIAAGVDLVAASGDKLLGGPQCGLLVGRADLIARIRKNPLLRAFRVDKLTYAALEATLFEYVVGGGESLPLMKILSAPADEIEKRCCAIVESIHSANLIAVVVPVESMIGGGTAPSARLKSYAVSVRHAELGAGDLQKKLRCSDPPVIARIAEEAVLVDLRTVPVEMDEAVARVLERL